MRRVVGVFIGFLLFFPGALVLRWLVVDELRLYQEMTLTDALLGIIIILACVIIFGQPRRALTAEELEDQARKMELASRRLERARRSHRGARTPPRSVASRRRTTSPSARRASSRGDRRADSRRPRSSRRVRRS